MSQTIEKLMDGGGQPGAGSTIGTAANRIGCEAAVLRAILEVESGGDPYDANGRLIILTEKHVFWRRLPKNLRNKARKLGLATPKWSRKNYGGLGDKGSNTRWKRLKAMVGLHETAGLKSASYGSAQIMGFNHKICGYPTVQSFVLALAETEIAQVEAFIKFLENSGLADELRERDFNGIARRYNGSGQVKYYAGLMRKAYAKISGGKPTTVKSVARQHGLRLGSEGPRVKGLQLRLIELGYHVSADGDFGPATRRQVVAFQADHGLKPDGVVGTKTEAALETAIPLTEQTIVVHEAIKPANGRADMSVKDLRKRGSKTVKEADRLTNVGGLTTGGGILAVGGSFLTDLFGEDLLGGVGDFMTEIQSTIAPIEALIPNGKWLVLIAIGLGVMWLAQRIKQRRLHDAVTWRHVG